MMLQCDDTQKPYVDVSNMYKHQYHANRTVVDVARIKVSLPSQQVTVGKIHIRYQGLCMSLHRQACHTGSPVDSTKWLYALLCLHAVLGPVRHHAASIKVHALRKQHCCKCLQQPSTTVHYLETCMRSATAVTAAQSIISLLGSTLPAKLVALQLNSQLLFPILLLLS